MRFPLFLPRAPRTRASCVSCLSYVMAAALVASCGGDKSETREKGSPEGAVAKTASAIQGGTLAKTQSFAVGILSQGICSATLIAPNLVLTARHCVEREPSQTQGGCENGALEDASALRITTGSAIDEGPYYQAKRILAAPLQGRCGPDMALIQLQENVPSSKAKPARPAVDHAYTSRAHFVPTVTAIGYGLDDNGQPGLRRIRENISVLCVPGDTEFDCGNELDGVLQDFEFLASEGACQGDSGGGLFDQESYSDDAPVVVGTVSRGPVDDQGKCGAGVYVRVDRFAAFISAAAKTAAQEGGYEPPDWIDSAAPPPAPDAATPEEEPEAPAAEPPAPVTTTTTTTTTGCSAAPGAAGGSTAPTAPLFALALALLVAKKARRRSLG